MIKLADIIRAKKIDLNWENYKIHFATGNNPVPLEAFFAGNFKEWQELQKNKNFQCDMVVGLIHLGLDKWLYEGIYKILGVQPREVTKFRYKTKLIPGQEDLIGRIVVSFNKDFRNSYVWGYKYGDLLRVSEIKPKKMSVDDFPGYNGVIISNHLLKTIVSQEVPSWKAALSNVNGVYLISDNKTGKLYVGSATGEGGVWQRWVEYASSGHGGNIELKRLLKAKGEKYSQNFQYSILEIADSHATDEYIVSRESHWKNVLLSREFGYNSN